MERDVWCSRLEFCKILTLWVNGKPEIYYSLLLFKASYEAYGKWVFLNKEGQFMQKLRLFFLFCKLHLFLDLMEPRVKTKKSLEKTVLQIWSQIKKKIALLAVKVGCHFLCKWRFANLNTHLSLDFEHFFTIIWVFSITSLLPLGKIWAQMAEFYRQNIDF